MMREVKPGYEPVLSAYNSQLMEEVRQRQRPQSSTGARSGIAAKPKQVRGRKDAFFANSYADMFSKKDVYVAQPSPPRKMNKECGFCGKALTDENECAVKDQISRDTFRTVSF